MYNKISPLLASKVSQTIPNTSRKSIETRTLFYTSPNMYVFQHATFFIEHNFHREQTVASSKKNEIENIRRCIVTYSCMQKSVRWRKICFPVLKYDPDGLRRRQRNIPGNDNMFARSRREHEA